MTMRSFAFLFFLCSVACIVQPATAQQNAVDFTQLGATVEAELRATNTPGAAVAVVIGDRVVFAKGYGVANVETGDSVTPHCFGSPQRRKC